MALISAPVLDDREDERMAAEAIGRVSGSLDVVRIDSQILALRALRELVAGGALQPAICPELTNANPSSGHTVLLETQAWQLSQQARKINQLPVRDQIEFHRLFGIELREATNATTSLQFSVGDVPVDTDVTVPVGTIVNTSDDEYSFATDEDLVIPYGEANGIVTATRTVAGVTILSAGVLTKMEDIIAFVADVTNPAVVDSGTEDETVDEALARATRYQRRGLRLVSERDLEDAILDDVLLGSGIVKAFPFVRAGDFSDLNHLKAGHTTVVVMTPTGGDLTDEVKLTIKEIMQQAIGAQFIYVIDPEFVDFSVEAAIKIESLTTENAVKAAVEANLRAFYAAKKGNFGRKILRSEIITVIEGTSGVDRIASDDDGPIVQSPAEDMTVAPYELPKLVAVTLTVVP